jgi:hypothetical protein
MADKDELKNHKLRVEFTIPETSPAAGPFSSATPRTPIAPGSSADASRTRPSVDTATSRSAATGANTSGASHALEVPGSPESIFAELQSLRKKYDAVVEYTVHLTAERDYHFTQLEEMKKEIAKEKAKKRMQGEGATAGGAAVGTTGAKKDGRSDKQVTVQQGFSFLVVILVAVISFFVARYTKA